MAMNGWRIVASSFDLPHSSKLVGKRSVPSPDWGRYPEVVQPIRRDRNAHHTAAIWTTTTPGDARCLSGATGTNA